VKGENVKGDMMNLLDLLRKLGILRSGAVAATYKTGAERPAELMMDDVYDANKDLVGGDSKPGERPATKS
jgi:hypothetical protein